MFLHLIGDSEEHASALVYDLIANDSGCGRRYEDGSIREIGVGTTDEVAPPSEPSRPISGTRLSSWWLAFKKIGKPQHALVLRRTSPPRRSRHLAIVDDRFHVRVLSFSYAFEGCCAAVHACRHRWVQRHSLYCV